MIQVVVGKQDRVDATAFNPGPTKLHGRSSSGVDEYLLVPDRDQGAALVAGDVGRWTAGPEEGHLHLVGSIDNCDRLNLD